ncbi:MAG TPA: DnaJ domain-containing protein [Vicinamibacterales bacterium]|jgi:hypothetical protein|nr:DnaJ domain-containing protein [Vicinamibacterales bacterium]
MRNGASFSEMLDAHLGCTVVPPPAPPRAWSSRPLTTPLFAFELPLTPARPVPVEAPLPVHLTSLERQTLEDASTPDALRRAYRALARRYHPDRHQGCSPAEREQLARLFAEATQHYRLLTRRF